MASLIPGETLRVLLVSPQESQRDAIGEALTEQAGDYRLYWVAQSELAAGRTQDLVPHVILVDDVLEATGPATLIAQLVQRAPGAAILAMVGRGDMVQARQAVLAGARGFVTKPVDPEELLASLRQVLGQRQAAPAVLEAADAPAGRVVVFCAPKGGTGRTTMAINVAVALQTAARRRVVMVDADYASPALDVALNIQSDRTMTDLIAKIGRLDEDLLNNVLASHATGIKVLLAPPPGELSAPLSLPHIQQVLSWLRRLFPWVLVDLGLPLDETAFAFLDGADRIVMSVLPEMVGLRNTRLMLDQMQARGYPEEKIWLVLNRSTLRGGVPPKDIEQRLRLPIQHKIPDDQPLATFSINRGVPVVTSHPQSALARSMQGLALALAQEAPVGEPRPAGRNLMSGLLTRRRPNTAGA